MGDEHPTPRSVVPSGAGRTVLGIRPAVPSDWPVLQDIEVRAGARFRDLGMDDIALAPPPGDDVLAAAAGVFVAVSEIGELIGYARLEILDDHTHLEQLSVLPEHGRRGVGRALLEAAITWAQGLRHDEITLTTFRDVPFNAPLYERWGFRAVPESEWSSGIRSLVQHEAQHGLDPRRRVVMRLLIR